jgi:hypothetical protein
MKFRPFAFHIDASSTCIDGLKKHANDRVNMPSRDFGNRCSVAISSSVPATSCRRPPICHVRLRPSCRPRPQPCWIWPAARAIQVRSPLPTVKLRLPHLPSLSRLDMHRHLVHGVSVIKDVYFYSLICRCVSAMYQRRISVGHRHASVLLCPCYIGCTYV